MLIPQEPFVTYVMTEFGNTISRTDEEVSYIATKGYYQYLKKKNLELITNAQRLYKDHPFYQKLGDVLSLLLNDGNYCDDSSLRATANTLLSILITEESKSSFQEKDQRDLMKYQIIEARLKKIQEEAEAIKKKDLKVNCQVKNLYYLDILSLILRQCEEYQLNCHANKPLLFFQDLCAMTIIDKDNVKKYLNYFHRVYSCLTFKDINQNISNLVLLLTLIQLRFKLYHLVRKTKDYSSLQAAAYQKIKQYQANEVRQYANSRKIKYRFSEVAFFMHFQEKGILPISWKNQIVAKLQRIAAIHDETDKKWALLQLKVNFSISLENLITLLRYVKRGSQSQIRRFFVKRSKHGTDIDKFYRFVKALNYIFVKDDSYNKAFALHGLDKEHRIQYERQNILRCDKYIESWILMSAAKRLQTYCYFTQKQLQQQFKLSKNLLISKYEYSYNQMRSLLSLPATEHNYQFTVIIGSINNTLIFSSVFHQILDDPSYLNNVFTLIKESKIQPPFNVVIYGFDDYKAYPRFELNAFIFKIRRAFYSRLYISNLVKTFIFNEAFAEFIFSKILTKCVQPPSVFAQLIEKEIYGLVQDNILKQNR